MKETFISHQTLWKGRAKPKDYSELKKRNNMMSYIKLRTYVSKRSKIIKQEVKRSSVVCPYEGVKSMGVKVITTQEMCKL